MTREPVRLLVWDLDDTFWHGTLSEGGMRYRRDTHAIVAELAGRGIVSSICSKNDLAPVREELECHGLWNWFVFPSIDWGPKGPRLAALIKAAQLRARNVMFIDDNPMNLAEAQHYVPDIQVAPESFIPDILASPLFAGKADPGFSRLRQYHLLARRQAGQEAHAGDNSAFLRESNIVATIDHDVERHMDRAIELITRTNQLNFTKRRRPMDTGDEHVALAELLGSHRVQAGLVRVEDRYGDYGWCGLYVLDNHVSAGKRLRHFCFSCRILGMGVETWLYRHLASPRLRVRGEVAVDILNDPRAVHWITLGGAPALAASAHRADAAPQSLDVVFLRGACDMRAIAHYFATVSGRVIEEFDRVRYHARILRCHSELAMHALRGIDAETIAACAMFEMTPEAFTSYISAPEPGLRAVWVLSFSLEYAAGLYRHRATGVEVPICVRGVPAHLDATLTDPAESGADPVIIAYLRDHFDYVGLTQLPALRENVTRILACAPAGTRVFILLGNTRGRGQDGSIIDLKPLALRNQAIAEAAAAFSAVDLVDIWDFVENEADQRKFEVNHFDRKVYFRLFQHMMRLACPDPDERPAISLP